MPYPANVKKAVGGKSTIKHSHLRHEAGATHHAQTHGKAIIPSGKHGYETHANKVRGSGQIGGGGGHRIGASSKHSSSPLSFTAGSGKSTV